MSELKKRIKAAISDIQRDSLYFMSDNRTFDFIEANPLNIDELIVNEKISAMNNGLMDTRYVPEMAVHILELDIDENLKKGDLTLVTKISALHPDNPYEFRKFASRYCNYHHPDVYPVQTEIAEEIMYLFVKDPDTPDGLPEDLQPYSNFCQVVDAFMDEYEFRAFNYYEMEKCMWLKSSNLILYFTDLSIRKNLKK